MKSTLSFILGVLASLVFYVTGQGTASAQSDDAIFFDLRLEPEFPAVAPLEVPKTDFGVLESVGALTGAFFLEEERRKDVLSEDEINEIIMIRKKGTKYQFLTKVGATFTDNARQTKDDEKNDYIISPSIGLLRTQSLGGGTSFSLGADLVVQRYEDQTDRDSDSAQFKAVGATCIGPYELSGSYFPRLVYQRGFDNHQITTHDLTVGVSRKFALDRKVLPICGQTFLDEQVLKIRSGDDAKKLQKLKARIQEWHSKFNVNLTANLTRRFVDPSSLNSTIIASGAAFSYELSSKVLASVTPSIRYTVFDRESGTRREDFRYQIGARLVGTPTDGIAISAGVSFAENLSDAKDADYNVFSVTPGVELSVNFKF